MAGATDVWSVLGTLTPFAFGAAVVSFVLILLLRPFLARYALAKPNARSSHKTPTPQGGGIAVVGATLMMLAAAAIFAPSLLEERQQIALVLVAVIGLAAIGATDDIWPMEALPRLLLQAVAVCVVITALPKDLHVLSALPWWLERAIMVIAILWFVNLVNFMDGLDLMTVAEVVPVAAGLVLFGLVSDLPMFATLIAISLCGAIIGFAAFNRPVARLFLGDVGSLPIGLLLGWLLLLLASRGHLAAALILPLYYVADATITLLRRLANGERVMQAHRGHFYQRARDNSFTVYQIVGRVFGLNIVLAGLAGLTLIEKSHWSQIIVLAAACILVAGLLWNFTRR